MCSSIIFRRSSASSTNATRTARPAPRSGPRSEARALGTGTLPTGLMPPQVRTSGTDRIEGAGRRDRQVLLVGVARARRRPVDRSRSERVHRRRQQLSGQRARAAAGPGHARKHRRAVRPAASCCSSTRPIARGTSRRRRSPRRRRRCMRFWRCRFLFSAGAVWWLSTHSLISPRS